MHIELKNGKMQNATYLGEVLVEKEKVYIILTNGTKYLEGIYENEEAAKSRREEILDTLKA